jgi:hypothetical protein
MPDQEYRARNLVFADRLVNGGVKIGRTSEILRGDGGAQKRRKRKQLHIPRLSGSRQNL